MFAYLLLYMTIASFIVAIIKDFYTYTLASLVLSAISLLLLRYRQLNLAIMSIILCEAAIFVLIFTVLEGEPSGWIVLFGWLIPMVTALYAMVTLLSIKDDLSQLKKPWNEVERYLRSKSLGSVEIKMFRSYWEKNRKKK
jgi:hypothetical protein